MPGLPAGVYPETGSKPLFGEPVFLFPPLTPPFSGATFAD